MKIAIFHEHLLKFGGAERVLQDLLKIWPQADIFCIEYDKKFTNKYFPKNKIFASFLQKMPFSKKHYNWYLYLEPHAIEKIDFSNYDLIISNSHSFGKGIKFSSKTKHICYCHTPTRWLWLDPKSHIVRSNYPFFIKWFIPKLIKKLKIWDYKAAQRPTKIVANSKNVYKRIKKIYNRSSKVIWPAIDLDFFKPLKNSERQNHFLYISRLEPHKRPDLAVKAFSQTKKKLIIAGDGTMKPYLEKIAGKNIEIIGEVSQSRLLRLYQSAQAVVFPQEEDFGLVSLEAQACGTPVIAYAKGGALETIIEGKTGVFFTKPTPEDLKSTIENFNSNRFSKTLIRQNAERFSFEKFKEKWIEEVEEVMEKNK